MLRGIHLPNTENARPISSSEAEAIGFLGVQALSLFDYHLTDPLLAPWLRHLAEQQGVRLFVRLVGTTAADDPAVVAARMVLLQEAYPFVAGWLPANEPNIEGGWRDWDDIEAWTGAVWWHVETYRRAGRAPGLVLYVPPLAQDAPLDHRDGYARLLGVIDLYRSGGDGIAWHEYWRAGDWDRRIDQEMPAELQSWLPGMPTLVHECGRLPDEPDKLTDLIAELTARYGSAQGGLTPASPARAVTPWLLGAGPSGTFADAAWVDADGCWRQVVYDYGVWGP